MKKEMGISCIWKIYILLSVFCYRLVSNDDHNEQLRLLRQNHRAKAIDDTSLWNINKKLGDIEGIHNILSKILIHRIPGTPNHDIVRQYIVDYMNDSGWSTEQSELHDVTPHGRMKFTNIISRLNPNAKRYLTLACHYDSKDMENFVGATDSAVPCAIMMNLASSLRTQMQAVKNSDLSLQFLFLDGEEAFVNWNARDSIYGARHLAQKWETENELAKIDLFVLLDLLGAAEPRFYSYFANTESWYFQLVDIESRLGAGGFLVEHAHNSAHTHKKRHQGYFQPYSVQMGIEDDHIPFLRRDVPILHLIPTPFPEVWHTPSDDLRALDFAAITNLNKIIGIFLMEYLHLD